MKNIYYYNSRNPYLYYTVLSATRNQPGLNGELYTNAG